MKNGVYQIRNLLNGKRYIGSAAEIKGFNKRWNTHRRQLNNRQHHSRYLQRAWSKYGADVFVFEILLYCDPKNCLMYEQIYLDVYQPEYNISPTARSPLGVKHTALARSNMSQAHKGIFDGDKNPFYGKRHSDEIRQQISISRKDKANGEQNGQGKLKTRDIVEIRNLLQRQIPQGKIAQQFNVAQTTISAIKNGKIWSHI